MPSYQHHQQVNYVIPRYQVTLQIIQDEEQILSFESIDSLRTNLCESIRNYGSCHICSIDIRTYGCDTKGVYYMLSSDCTPKDAIKAIEAFRVSMLTTPSETYYVTSKGVKKMTDRLRL